jgi:hypothetical protein
LAIVSNDSAALIKVVLAASLGKNWHKLFDLVVVNAKKPLF